MTSATPDPRLAFQLTPVPIYAAW